MERLTVTGVEEYLAGLFSSEDEVLAEMDALARARDFPIVGPLVGGLLEVLTRTSRAGKILELGSGFGYSAYWFARGLVEEGKIVLTDGKKENLTRARGFLERGGFRHRFEYFEGDALDRLEASDESWDLIFCDIDKDAYPKVVDPAAERLRPGGLLLFDNVFWSGRVLPEAGKGDEATEAIRSLNRRLSRDPRFRTTIFPLRDGVAVAVRV